MLHGIGSALTQIDFCQVIHLRLWSTMTPRKQMGVRSSAKSIIRSEKHHKRGRERKREIETSLLTINK